MRHLTLCLVLGSFLFSACGGDERRIIDDGTTPNDGGSKVDAGDDDTSDDDTGDDDTSDDDTSDDDTGDDDAGDDDTGDDDTSDDDTGDDDTGDDDTGDDDTGDDDTGDDDTGDDDAPEVCVDADGDGYGNGCPKGYDCDDSDPMRFQIIEGYTDNDGDGYTVEPPGSPVSVCSGTHLPAGYRTNSLGLDCNDQNAALKDTCGAFMLQDIATPNPLRSYVVPGSSPVMLGKSTVVLNISGRPPMTVDTAYFAAITGVDGRELWRTDGTEAGTWMVKDALPGAASPTFEPAPSLGGKLLYLSDDGLHRKQLWVTDGTAGGTSLVKELAPAPADPNIKTFIPAGGRTFFLSRDGISAHALSVSDGTAAGTRQTTVYNPYDPVAVRGNVYYPEKGWPYEPKSLMVSDGSVAGTKVLYSQMPGDNQILTDIFSAGDKLFIVSHKFLYDARMQLWVSDGTSATPKLVFRYEDSGVVLADNNQRFFRKAGNRYFFRGVSDTWGAALFRLRGVEGDMPVLQKTLPSAAAKFSEATELGNRLIYSADVTFDGNRAGRWQLWATEVNAAGEAFLGANVIADFGPSSGTGNQATELTTAGDRVFFLVDDGVHGNELWVTDGTASGTRMVKDINPGVGGSNASGLTVVNGKVVFVADNGSTGAEPWVSDGTEAGTKPLCEIGRTFADSSPAEFVSFGGQVLFSANNTAQRGPVGRELWKTDGTPSGTGLFADLYPGLSSSSPQNLTPIGNTLYFSATDGSSHGRELWKSDGTAAGTAMVKDIETGATGSDPYGFTKVGNNVLFVAKTTTAGLELWKTQGTAATTTILKDINPGTSDSDPQQFVPFDGGALFVASSSDAGGRELWFTDGDTSGTRSVKDIRAGSAGSFPRQLFPCGDVVYFTADDGVNGRELWLTDGTELGTKLVSNVASGSASSEPADFTCWDGAFYFTAKGPEGRELYRALTPGIAPRMTDINPGVADSNPRLLTVSGDHLYFVATDTTRGEELWRITGDLGDAPQLVKDIYPGKAGSSISQIVDNNGTLLFFADDGVHGRELWRSGGTAATTSLVKDIMPGVWTSGASGLTSGRDGVFLFFASDGVSGWEMWRTDGTTAGTRLLQDITPRAQGTAFSSGPVRIGNQLYFGASDGTNGAEPWSIYVDDL